MLGPVPGKSFSKFRVGGHMGPVSPQGKAFLEGIAEFKPGAAPGVPWPVSHTPRKLKCSDPGSASLSSSVYPRPPPPHTITTSSSDHQGFHRLRLTSPPPGCSAPLPSETLPQPQGPPRGKEPLQGGQGWVPFTCHALTRTFSVCRFPRPER